MEGLTEGRMVHYCLPDDSNVIKSIGAHRPAIVVLVCPTHWYPEVEGRVNLQVFIDGSNDIKNYEGHPLWMTSVPYSEEPKPNTWHWIEKA